MLKNKKFIFSLVSALLIMTTVFAPVAYASNPYNNVWKSSSESVQKFNEYIASLPEENARLILEDEELVFMMKLDSYWEPDTVSTNAVKSSSLPLSAYPAGNYFSYNGESCDCHDECDYVVSTGGVSTRCYVASTKKPGNCIRYAYTGGIQCKGFADYVYHEYTSHNVKAAYKLDVSNYTSISKDSAGATKMKTFFSSLPDGSNVRLTARSGGRHSVIVNDASNNGVYIYDANRVEYKDGERCKIGYEFLTWSELASLYKGIYSAWTA